MRKTYVLPGSLHDGDLRGMDDSQENPKGLMGGEEKKNEIVCKSDGRSSPSPKIPTQKKKKKKKKSDKGGRVLAGGEEMWR